MRARLLALTLAIALLGAGSEARSGADCGKASEECDKARAELSDATRNADSKAAAYVACTEQKAAATCSAQKKAMDTAMGKKKRAQEAYRFAAAKKKAACE